MLSVSFEDFVGCEDCIYTLLIIVRAKYKAYCLVTHIYITILLFLNHQSLCIYANRQMLVRFYSQICRKHQKFDVSKFGCSSALIFVTAIATHCPYLVKLSDAVLDRL